MNPRYSLMPARRRWWILLLTVATTVALWYSMIYRPGDSKRGQVPKAAAPPVCTDGRSTGCVGGKAELILVPPRAPPASSP